MKKLKIKLITKLGFTLVELIVVITILSILGTIAFVSLQGFSKSARDSRRMSDISNIKTALELYNINAGRYPEPDEVTNVTYSGSTVWSQGVVGDGVIRNLIEIPKIPLDPLLETEYAYSLLNTKKEYELGSILEGDVLSGNKIINNTYANKKRYYAYIKGTYNGQVVKVTIGNNTFVFAVPSIISSDLGEPNILDIIRKMCLAFNGYQNIPDNYKGQDIVMTGSFDFGGAGMNPIIYSGSLKELTSSGTILKDVGENIHLVYNGSILSNNPEYEDIAKLDPNNNDELLTTVGVIINNNLGGDYDIPVLSGGTGGGEEENGGGEEAPLIATLVKDGLGIVKMQEYNGKIIFITHPFLGGQLGISDGTEEGTFILNNEITGQVQNFIEYNGKIYFDAAHAANESSDGGNELYVSDGTIEGTKLFKEFNYPQVSDGYTYDSFPQDFKICNGKLFFVVSESVSGENELRTTDGTESGTNVLASSLEGPIGSRDQESSFKGGESLSCYNNNIYFSKGEELWITDGTVSNTKLVKYLENSIFYTNFKEFNGKLFFTLDNYNSETNERIDQLGYINSINDELVILKNLPGGVETFTEYNGKLFFNCSIAPYRQLEYWLTDGTSEGTKKIPEPNNYFFKNGITFLSKYNDETELYELWVTKLDSQGDMIQEETKKIEDNIMVDDDIFSTIFTEFNGKLYYSNNSKIHVTDGTPEGTNSVSDIDIFKYYNNMISFDGKLFYIDKNSYGLWYLE